MTVVLILSGLIDRQTLICPGSDLRRGPALFVLPLVNCLMKEREFAAAACAALVFGGRLSDLKKLAPNGMRLVKGGGSSRVAGKAVHKKLWKSEYGHTSGMRWKDQRFPELIFCLLSIC